MKTKESDSAVSGDIAFFFSPFFASLILVILSNKLLWASIYSIAISVVIFGGILIFRAKLPVYKQWRFLTFGVQALPEASVILYKRGWTFVVRGVLLAAVLLGWGAVIS